MGKIEIIEYDEPDDSEDEDEEENEEDEDDSEDEEEFEEEEEVGEFGEDKSSIKQKTDRELLENISIKINSLENEIKHIREDLVDIYNLIIESEAEEEDE